MLRHQPLVSILGMVGLALGVCFAAPLFASAEEEKGDAEKPAAEAAAPSAPPAFDDFLIVPLRVHVLSSKDLEEVDCHLTDADLARILGKVNGVWRQAGVCFGLESILREAAEGEEEFRNRQSRAEDRLPNWLTLRPLGSRAFKGMSVYYVHKLPVNGVFLGHGIAFVQETAKLRKVIGGIDEPIPRVTSHELGHALSLAHRQDTTNLMASGTTGTSLNAAEIEAARKTARAGHGRPAPEIRTAALEAEKQDQKDEARRLWSWLAEIPGSGQEEAREHGRALEAEAKME